MVVPRPPVVREVEAIAVDAVACASLGSVSPVDSAVGVERLGHLAPPHHRRGAAEQALRADPVVDVRDGAPLAHKRAGKPAQPPCARVPA